MESAIKWGPELHRVTAPRLRATTHEEYIEVGLQKTKQHLCYRVVTLNEVTGEVRPSWPADTEHRARLRADDLAKEVRSIEIAVMRMRKKGVVEVIPK